MIELLVVLAVIAILVGIMLPVVSGVLARSATHKTQSQFAQYAIAYESFKADYGFYPSMGMDESVFGLARNNPVFIQTLSGRRKDGSRADHGYALRSNQRLIRYYTFGPSDFGLEDTAYAGELVDGFGNPNVYVVIDRDRNGVIEGSTLSGLPEELRPDRLNGGVFFYSSNASNNPDWEWVLSWE